MSETGTIRPTMKLRWVPKSSWVHDLKLQQAFEVTHYNKEGKVTHMVTEWRDVPVERG